MADDSKTEKASPKKRRDQRKKGNVFQSKDIVALVTMIASFYGLKIALPYFNREISKYLRDGISLIATMPEVTGEHKAELLTAFLIVCCKTLVPFMLLMMVVGILGSGVQTQFLFASENLKPKFERINPLQGIKKMFSMKNVIELIKGILKLTVLCWVIINFIKGNVLSIISTMNMDVADASAYLLKTVMRMLTPIFICFTFIAAFDLFYQWWDYENQLKMSKQEVKEEFKQLEGNPEIKGKIKEKQRAMSRGRMMQAVPEADVVIKNPTHFAVALKYDMDKNRAPIVVAMGQDSLALRIIKVAEDNNVHVIENIPLARGLYAACQIDQEIPAEFYSAIAEILIYIYQMDHKDLSDLDKNG